jgi:hypothetical protein
MGTVPRWFETWVLMGRTKIGREPLRWGTFFSAALDGMARESGTMGSTSRRSGYGRIIRSIQERRLEPAQSAL